jgi:mono/diheme cytochrome c family protein
MKILLALALTTAIGSASLVNQEDELAKSIKKGKLIYSDNCISCHLGNGLGVPSAVPPLAKSDYFTKNPENAIKAVKFGLLGKITVNGTTYDNMMPNPGLDDTEIADVINYILNEWGNDAKGAIITPKMVAEVEE